MKNPSHKEILLVDDDPNYTEVIRLRLEKSGYGVRCALNGREAMEALEHEQRPDLIIMDLDMPDQNGLTTLINMGVRRAEAGEGESAGIPVIVATGLRSDQVRKIIMDQKVSGYLRKPYDSEELVRTIEQLIG